MRQIEIYIVNSENLSILGNESMRVWSSQFDSLNELLPRLANQIFNSCSINENFILEIKISTFTRYIKSPRVNVWE